jgi:hypothetical protein
MPVTFVIAFVNGTSTSCRPRRFCFWPQRFPAFIPRRAGLALLFPTCFLLGAAVFSRRYRHLHWSLGRRSRFSLMGGPGAHPCMAIHHLQASIQPYRRDSALLYGTASISVFLPEGECGRAAGSRIGTFSSPSRTTWLIKSTDVSSACTTSSPRRNSSVILATNTQVSGRGPRVSFTKASYKICHLQGAPRGLVSLWQTSGDVQPGDGHGSFCVSSYKT